ncbi:MAG: hypothetical protein E3K37_17395 [Candidatus Kuenenia sp.]|nr:hypothetical protein [Candidatus Kuenenia hertensis]
MIKPDILETVQGTGIELVQRGNRFWGLCPFHSERTASFCVDPEKQRFRCFGCHASGDVIDFIQRLKGVSFKAAVKALNIKDFQASDESRRQRALKTAFDRWISNYSRELGETIRLVNRIDQCVIPESLSDIQNLDEIYLRKEIAEHYLEILTGNNLNDQITLWRAVNE